jgi:hypothetical protein
VQQQQQERELGEELEAVGPRVGAAQEERGAAHAQPCGQREREAVARADLTQEQRGKRGGQSDADAARRGDVPAAIHGGSGGAHARRRAQPGQQQQQPRRQPRRQRHSRAAAECEGCRGGGADANQRSKPRE